MAKNCCPSSSSARRLRQEPSITKNCCTSSSKLKPRAQVAREFPPTPQGTTALTTPPFVKAGFDCRNNTTVGRRPEAVGWAPSCDPAPLTTSFGTVGQWERRHRAMCGTNEGAATQKPSEQHKGAATQKPTSERRNSRSNLGARGGVPRTLALWRH